MKMPLVAAVAVLFAACERQSAPPATAPSSTQRVAEHLKAAGEELKAAATEAATQIKPALERAAEEAREGARRVGEKIENATSQPATQP